MHTIHVVTSAGERLLPKLEGIFVPQVPIGILLYMQQPAKSSASEAIPSKSVDSYQQPATQSNTGHKYLKPLFASTGC